jgi:hypothetical protein
MDDRELILKEYRKYQEAKREFKKHIKKTSWVFVGAFALGYVGLVGLLSDAMISGNYFLFWVSYGLFSFTFYRFKKILNIPDVEPALFEMQTVDEHMKEVK